MKVAAALVFFLVASVRCAGADVDLRGIDQPPVPAVSQDEIAPYLQPGTASIRGRVLADLPGTRKLVFASARVTLEPAVPFAAWLADRDARVGARAAFPLAVPAATRTLFDTAVRRTRADGRGVFRFTNLPALPFVVVVYPVEREPRTGYQTSTDYVSGMELGPDPANPGESELVPTYGPETTTTPYEYTCVARGALYGLATAVAGADVPVALGLVASTNDGC